MKSSAVKRILATSLAASLVLTGVGFSQTRVSAKTVEEDELVESMEIEMIEESVEKDSDGKEIRDEELGQIKLELEEDIEQKAAAGTNLFVDGDLGDDDGDDIWSGNWSFGDGDSTWDILGTNPIAYSEWAKYNSTKGLGISFNNSAGTMTMYQSLTGLDAGTYTISGYAKETTGAVSSIQGYHGSTDTKMMGDATITSDFSQFTFTFTLDSAVTDYKVGFLITSTQGAWICLDSLSLTKNTSEDEQKTEAIADLNNLITECTSLQSGDYTADSYAVLQEALEEAQLVYDNSESKTLLEINTAITTLTEAKDGLVDASIVDTGASGIFVEKLSLNEEFIKGVDISSYISITDSGAVFRDWNGNVVSDAGFFTLLKDAGVNWVRIRVWNNPYDKNGNGYGGGNNDIEKAGILGKLATDAGLKVLIDFHYSDFWADPAMQDAPKEWESMGVDEKAEAVEIFTKSSLDYLDAWGVDVRMVQIGNETNNGICGESEWANRAKIFNAGARGVRAYEDEKYGTDVTDGSEVMVAVHFTEPNTGIQATIAQELAAQNVTYDVFATSYYPFWHGTLDNLNSVLSSIATTYGKKVMVAETSYAYTYEDGDGHENNVRADKASSLVLDYNISAQGQADAVSSIMKTLDETTNAIGLFYWEPAWIPVQKYDASAADAEAVLSSNRQKWETYGSGWAASYSAEYDPENAGRYYGGSSWDNQGLFDHNGNPLASLNVFKYVDTGATTTVRPDVAKSVSALFVQGESYTLPAMVEIVNNDGSRTETPITWDAAQVAALGKLGSTTVNGIAAGLKTICNVEILPHENLLKNGDFEMGLGDGNGWTVNGDTNGIIKIDTKDIKRGSNALKFDAWETMADNIIVTQTVTGLKAGIYNCFMNVEGAAESGTYTVSITAKGENEVTDTADLLGWMVWDKAESSGIRVAESGSVTVTITINTTAKEAWGTIDDVFLYSEEEDAIIYELNGGTNHADNPSSYNAMEEVILKDPTHEGYIFKGWYTDANFTTPITKIVQGTTGTVTVYAKWEKEDNAETSTKVTKIKLNKSKVGLQKGKTVTLKAVVTPETAENKKVTWKSSSPNVAKVDKNGKVKALKLGKATITATAEDGSGVSASCKVTCGYKITYKLNKGTNHKENPAVYYKEKVSLKKPTRKGYSFEGWYTDKNFKKKITSISKSSKKNITVYAKWKKVKVAKVSLSKVTNVSKFGMKVSVKKVSGAKGYEITYSTNKNFKKNNSSVLTKKQTTTIKNLKKGKTYYVKVRAYKKDSAGNKVYGAYSKVQKLKINK